jgi:hypothetical protein
MGYLENYTIILYLILYEFFNFADNNMIFLQLNVHSINRLLY